MKGKLLAYTDGSTFQSNPGPMSWAVVYVRDGMIERTGEGLPRELTGACETGTNNRAELMGVIWALENETSESLIVMTDSLVTMKCATGVYRRNANKDLWERFEKAMTFRERRGLATEFCHVKGHHVDPFNRKADKLASEHAKAAFAIAKSVDLVTRNPV